MKKYRHSFPKSAIFVYVLIVLASITAIVFAALRLVGVGNYVAAYPALEIASIVVFVIFVALIGANLFTSYYAFTEKGFVVVQLFSRKGIARETICKMMVDEESGVAAIYYIDDATPDTLSFVTVNIRRALLDAFEADLRTFKSDVVIEIIPVKRDEE